MKKKKEGVKQGPHMAVKRSSLETVLVGKSSRRLKMRDLLSEKDSQCCGLKCIQHESHNVAVIMKAQNTTSNADLTRA